MKKLSVLLVFMLTASVAMYASPAKCLLHHNGSVTLYDSEDINSALTAAVDGDTLYLSEGAFSGFTITKKITVRGSGQMTRIGGNINVEIPNAPTLTSTLLEGVNSSADILINSEVTGLQIKQSRFRDFVAFATINEAVIDKSFIFDEFWLNEFTQGITCTNCKILTLMVGGRNDHGGAVLPTSNQFFINCNICSVFTYGADCYLTLVNCIINGTHEYYGTTYYIKESFINNCLFYKKNIDAATSSEYSCYVYDGNVVDGGTLECLINETLAEKGYLGQDGTIVGCYGGPSPFTLDLPIPKVTATNIQIDNDTKQLSVTLNVTAK